MSKSHFKVSRGLSLIGQSAAPSDPQNGDIYYDTALNLFQKYENGVWGSFGSGTSSGSGATNYVTNANAETDTAGWATYADAAGTSPVDGIGGSPTLTLTRSTSSPLHGTGSFLATQPNSTNIQGQGISYDFTLDSGDQSKVIGISFDYTASSTFIASSGQTGSDSDIKVFMYDRTNAVLIPVSPNVLVSKSTPFSFSGTFQTASNSTSYRLILHVPTTSNNATGWTLKFDNVFVGPQVKVMGAPVTDWTSFVMPITGSSSNPTKATSPTVDQAMYRRVGDSIEIHYTYQHTANTGAAAGSGVYIFGLPSGLSIDTAKIGSSTGTQGLYALGEATVLDPTNESYKNIGVVTAYNTTGLAIEVQGGGTNNATNTSSRVSNSFMSLTTSTIRYTFYAVVPIAGWGSTVALSQDTDTRVVTAYAWRTGTQSFADNTTTTVVLNTIAFDSHSAFNTSTGIYTVPVSGYYQVSASIRYSSNSTGTRELYIRKNGTTYYLNDVVTRASGAVWVNGSTIVNCVAGDTIALAGLQDSGGSLNIDAQQSQTFMAVHRISGPATIASTETIAAAYNTATGTVSGSDTVVKYTVKEFDTHGAYSTSTGLFTTPASGKYRINGTIYLNATYAAGQGPSLIIYVNGVAVKQVVWREPAVTTNATCSISTLLALNAGDTVGVYANSNGTSPAYNATASLNFLDIIRLGN